MMHKAWSSIEEVPYCFSRSYVKLQGHTAKKIIHFDPNWAFPDCNSSLNSPMAMKCCTKLETAKEKCPIVLQGHPSNFKVTRDKTSPMFTQIGRFRTIGRSQLSNPSDLPCYFFFFLFIYLFIYFFFFLGGGDLNMQCCATIMDNQQARSHHVANIVHVDFSSGVQYWACANIDIGVRRHTIAGEY